MSKHVEFWGGSLKVKREALNLAHNEDTSGLRAPKMMHNVNYKLQGGFKLEIFFA